ncbi:MAG: hypothetical protein IKL42_06930 [Clostridia bacterium]|nr:hypothetical protein [Clostridia bacterium]
MAENVRKMSEVPKGQRFQFFIDYFGGRTLLIIVGIICVAYIIYALNQPKPDARVLMASYEDFATQEVLGEIENAFNEQEMDFNEDGRVMMQVNYNYLDQKLMQTAPESYVTLQTKLMTSVGDTLQIYHILDESAYQLFYNFGAIGTYADFEGYETGHAPEEYVKIPLSEISAFDKEILGKDADKLFLTIRPKANAEVNRAKNLDNYNDHIDALAKVLGFAKTN